MLRERYDKNGMQLNVNNAKKQIAIDVIHSLCCISPPFSLYFSNSFYLQTLGKLYFVRNPLPRWCRKWSEACMAEKSVNSKTEWRSKQKRTNVYALCIAHVIKMLGSFFLCVCAEQIAPLPLKLLCSPNGAKNVRQLIELNRRAHTLVDLKIVVFEMSAYKHKESHEIGNSDRERGRNEPKSAKWEREEDLSYLLWASEKWCCFRFPLILSNAFTRDLRLRFEWGCMRHNTINPSSLMELNERAFRGRYSVLELVFVTVFFSLAWLLFGLLWNFLESSINPYRTDEMMKYAKQTHSTSTALIEFEKQSFTQPLAWRIF